MNETSSDSLLWTVTHGAVFKIRTGKAMKIFISLRNRDGNWLDASEMSDIRGDYKDLGVDQFSLVQVCIRDENMRCRDVSTVTLERSGDSTTVAKAIHSGVLSKMLVTSFDQWLKKVGPLKLHWDNSDTCISHEMLAACYDKSDFPALRKAYAHELSEDLASHEDRESLLEKGIATFNAFIDKADGPEDRVFWYEKWAPLASRAGYVIIREGKILAHMLMLMS